MLERSNPRLELCRDLINGANSHDANLALLIHLLRLYLGTRGLPDLTRE